MAESERQFESALILVVPEAEELVASYRLKHDPGARLGIPAHVTVLYPFLAPEQIGEAELKRLAELFAAQSPIQIRFEGTERFPDVLYLQPLPLEPIVALTLLVAAAYPDYPPYGGVYPNINPHLTIAYVDDDALLKRLDQQVMRDGRGRLPITSDVREVSLYEEQAEGWSLRATFPLGN